jgi:hypothetical protein
MGALEPPRITAAPGCYIVAWQLETAEIAFEADRLRDHSDGSLKAVVRVTATRRSGEQHVLSAPTQLNLTAGRSRRELSRILEERLPGEADHFDQLIEESCRLILEREQEGNPAQILQPAANVKVEYVLRPLLLAHLPVLWYAPGGSGKSLLAMYSALLVQNGLPFLGERTRQENVLYLDWEVTKEEADRRCTLLAHGLEQKLMGTTLRYPLYRRCNAPLVDEASEIAKDIAKHKVGLVIVDSAGPACGDIMSPDLAIQFFNALRKVTAPTNAASKTLTHTTKADRREENQHRLPFGSVYWENMPRATWEIRPQETNDQNLLQVGLFPRKQNMARPPAVGLRLSFQTDAIAVESVAVDDVTTGQGATQSMILGEMERGPVSVKELVEATGADANVVRVLLTRLKKRGVVDIQGRGVWSLVGERTP